MLTRNIKPFLEKHISENRILLLVGPKGNSYKETLFNFFPNQDELLKLDCSEKKTKRELELNSVEFLQKSTEKQKHILLEEAQLLSNLQTLVEFILFENDKLSLICYCSTLPALNPELMEALHSQGLIQTFHSPSFHEMATSFGVPQFEKSLDQRLVYGNFEEVLSNQFSATEFLEQQVEKILQTNMSSNDRINKKDRLLKLLQYLAFTIGEHVSYNEVGSNCDLDNETVERYVDLLEKSFVLIKIPIFFNDKKYELKKAHCFYFYDNGIRNALIHNFNPIDIRMDAHQLWKNWLIVEKLKLENLTEVKSHFFFWKTHTKQTVDLIQIHPSYKKAFQFQWHKKEKRKFTASFTAHYPEIKTSIINKTSYWTFLAK